MPITGTKEQEMNAPRVTYATHCDACPSSKWSDHLVRTSLWKGKLSRAEGIDTGLIDPGKPWQNGTDESFNGRFRDECLSLERFRSRAEARVVIENWRRHDSAVRPHSSLAYLTPHEFKQQHQPLHNRAVFQE